MSFIQTDLDRAAFIRSASWLERESRQARPLDIAFSCAEPAASATTTPRLIDEIAAAGLPGLTIPLITILTAATPPAWLLAALGLPLLGAVAKVVVPHNRAALWLPMTGYAALALGLLAVAGDHLAALIAYAGILPATYLAIPLTAVLALTGWVMAQRNLAMATRDLLVIEGLALALTLIVLANHATLGGAAFATYQGTAPLPLIAADVGLTTLSPILSAGIAFSFFVAGLRSFKAAANAYVAASGQRSLPPRKPVAKVA
jgi:hypothetical protein